MSDKPPAASEIQPHPDAPEPCPLDHSCDLDDVCGCWCDLHDCPIENCPSYKLVTAWVVTNPTFGAIVAPIDARLSLNDRHVLALVGKWNDATLDALCARTSLPKPYVFLCVARLEEMGYLPAGVIR